MLIQLVLVLILLGAMWLTRKRMKQGAISGWEGYGWSLLWLFMAGVVLQPQIASRAASFVGVGRGSDLVVYLAIVGLLILVFRLHVAHDRLEKQLTELIRREALSSLPSVVSDSEEPKPPVVS